jgi:3-isopropylmalate dehydrogenase
LLPSASIGIHTSVFEPIHGSYPQAAGKNIANPLGTILSAALMFEYALGMPEAGQLIHQACEKSIEQGVVTADIAAGKAYTTSEVGDWIANFIQR